jgi:tRNA-specific 2-thiouridylase
LKTDVKETAKEQGIAAADRPESQEICFVQGEDYAQYIDRMAGAMPKGNFIDETGKVLGEHKGIHHYTVGQRKGLGLALGYPAFVIEIRPETNEVVIGTNDDSMSNYVRANKLNFMSIEDLTKPMRVFAKIRYNHKGAWCTIEKTSADEVLCTFEEQQRAITPGQAVVFYDGEYVLGGGTILHG